MIEREEEEKSRGFKVDDRRRFSAEGEPKPEHEAAEAPPPHPQPAQEPPPRQREAQAATQAPPPPEINFVTFVVSLSTQALIHLGEFPDPMPNHPAPPLPAAPHMISLPCL